MKNFTRQGSAPPRGENYWTWLGHPGHDKSYVLNEAENAEPPMWLLILDCTHRLPVVQSAQSLAAEYIDFFFILSLLFIHLSCNFFNMLYWADILGDFLHNKSW